MKTLIDVENFNLDLTFAPSFVSTLYQKIGLNNWVKVAGHLGNQLEFKQLKTNRLEVNCSAGLTQKALQRRATIETGLWRGPYEERIGSLPKSVQPQIQALAEAYPGVRLPIVPLDFPYMLTSVALSKRTGYSKFVLQWCQRIWSIYSGRIDLVAQAKKRDLQSIGRSYQVLQLQKTLRSFSELSTHPERLPKKVLDLIGEPYVPAEEFLLWLTPELARMTLIRGCWGIGPKVADSIILSTFKASHFIPCDTHLRTVAERLELANMEGAKMPSKVLCSKYVCDQKTSIQFKVPLCSWSANGACLRSRLMYLLKTGGWVQTLTYLHGERFCKAHSPKCKTCPIKSVCPNPPT
jgi:hypothetical protein